MGCSNVWWLDVRSVSDPANLNHLLNIFYTSGVSARLLLLQQRAEAAGFETVECAYHCVVVHNRQLRLDMKRVFVHGLFRRP